MNISLHALALSFALSLSGFVHAANSKMEWVLVDLAKEEGLSALLGGADAILSVKETAENSQTARPMVRIYREDKLKKPADEKLATARELARLNTPAGKNGKGVILSERALGENKYAIEFSTSTEDKDSNLYSIYLVMKDGDRYFLFVFDGLSTGRTKLIQQVKDLYAKMNPALLRDYFAHAANKKKI